MLSKLLRSKTKIIATLGPSSSSKKTINELIQAGVNVFRLNMSHGTHEDVQKRIKAIRGASKELGVAAGILCDFQGPKLRVGRFEKPVMLKRNQHFSLLGESVIGTDAYVSAPSKTFHELVKLKEPIYLNDGLIKMVVESIEGRDVHCRVLVGGILSDHKGVNLPGSDFDIPILTAKDKRDIRFAVEQGIGIFAFSFIQYPYEVEGIRTYLKRLKWDGFLISKIEKPNAIQNLLGIMDLSDGLLVARGDLGVEMNLERVPMLQKKIIRQCNRMGKVVITATQMLESMVLSPAPTRAEVSDVANAVCDGSDAVMLSAETAAGKYPVQSVKIMRSIVSEVETGKIYQEPQDQLPTRSVDHVVTRSAVHGAEYLRAKAIVCHTESGHTAKLISKCHPTVPVIAFTPCEKTYNRMSLFYGVYPIRANRYPTTEKMITMGDREVLKRKLAKHGDKIVIVTGEVQVKGATNSIKVHTM